MTVVKGIPVCVFDSVFEIEIYYIETFTIKKVGRETSVVGFTMAFSHHLHTVSV